MTSKSRASRREAARHQPGPSASRWLLPVVGVGIAVVALAAIILSQGASGAGASPAPSFVAAVPPTITGEALPPFQDSIGDTAKGLAAPVVKGQDYQGEPVEISPSGRPTIVVFAAHWCSHCQREIPILQDWVDAGRLPADVDMIAVSTAIEPKQPNYPPEEWFASEGWTSPIIVDPTNTVATAYGLTSYPFFTILDGAGNVFARLAGEVPVSDLEQILAAVPRT